VTAVGREVIPSVSHEQVVWQACSVLLSYPDDEQDWRLPALQAAIDRLPQRLSVRLTRFLAYVETTPLLDRAAEYDATFDNQRRCCLYLTYYAHGDTRKRGMALLAFKDAYRARGLELGADELPDHLAVVLEFAATVDSGTGRRLLIEHRAGIELLRLALEDRGSPYAHVLAAVTATLPALRGDERDAVARLVAAGPPAEEVGLEPFAPPEYMPPAYGARR
jgi:nitrate reductase delta subunit